MRARTAAWLAIAAALVAGSASAGPPTTPAPAPAAPSARSGPTCEAAARQDREAANLAALVEALKRLERQEPPGADGVVALDNRGYNYGEPLIPFPELPRQR